MLSLARNNDPVAVILVLGPPAAISRLIVAPTGVGIGVGVGLGVGVGVGLGVGDAPGDATPATATSTNHAGTMTRTLSDLTRRPKGTSDRRPGD